MRIKKRNTTIQGHLKFYEEIPLEKLNREREKERVRHERCPALLLNVARIRAMKKVQ
jgi:hypothetical protein